MIFISFYLSYIHQNLLNLTRLDILTSGEDLQTSKETQGASEINACIPPVSCCYPQIGRPGQSLWAMDSFKPLSRLLQPWWSVTQFAFTYSQLHIVTSFLSIIPGIPQLGFLVQKIQLGHQNRERLLLRRKKLHLIFILQAFSCIS